ncbi:TPM domain-containing protein [Synechococcus sp. Tobar12-5m-g]|uniref:photosystem II repair protein Psb32 n=1 Tax=unclassified Synechococcus TaxID=2626047 RepID=UPI0020CBC03B|nr:MULTISPECIES: TPM domain-containing protein [unclassified Synechococcus]MCP9773531.1 TPM domain-containing protein [Synechococcus sp. Tobar12-5m-g]MCP9874484.1 TPM domain-containing protein [Synechococcus sp. Cruz CV-v-12]
MRPSPLLSRLLAALAVLVVGWIPLQAAWAASASDYPALAPQGRVTDSARLFSRSTDSELERRLSAFEASHVQARLVTVDRLDYGLELDTLGADLIQRWRSATPNGDTALLLLIDAQTNTAAVVASPDLLEQLPASLLRSTADTTMNIPLRMGSRYRQASIDALNRLEQVLGGADDPGPPQELEQPVVVSSIPTMAETAAGSGFTWVVVLLAVGTIVPMLTWWVFSR